MTRQMQKNRYQNQLKSTSKQADKSTQKTTKIDKEKKRVNNKLALTRGFRQKKQNNSSNQRGKKDRAYQDSSRFYRRRSVIDIIAVVGI